MNIDKAIIDKAIAEGTHKKFRELLMDNEIKQQQIKDLRHQLAQEKRKTRQLMKSLKAMRTHD